MRISSHFDIKSSIQKTNGMTNFLSLKMFKHRLNSDSLSITSDKVMDLVNIFSVEFDIVINDENFRLKL